MKTIFFTSTLTIALLILAHSSAAQEHTTSQANNGKSPAIATFAGGCFWCVESDFEKLDGVIEAVSGYTGGHVKRPKYKQVSSGKTGHFEAVQIQYDPEKVSYRELVEYLFRHIDPTDPDGQFVDRGQQYSTAIFFHDEEQKKIANQVIEQFSKAGFFKKPIVTPVLQATKFYPAETYHQDYHKRNSWKYKYYRYRSGRDDFLDETWDK
jgi:peptide methionine sulfoxide reductase msrA/msrB